MMLSVAIEREAEGTRLHYAAVQAAVAGLFDKKAPKAFLEGLDRVKASVKAAQARARGAEPDADAAAAMLEAFQKAGMRPIRRRRS